MAESLRSAGPQDAQSLAALDAIANPSPWSEAAFRETLAHCPGWLLEAEDGALLGFVLCRTAADEAEILDIAVAPHARRRGIGGALLATALAAAARAGARRAFLEVRASNTAAQALYRAAGFLVDGRRKSYYRTGDGCEDALLMSRGIP